LLRSFGLKKTAICRDVGTSRSIPPRLRPLERWLAGHASAIIVVVSPVRANSP
jgi:hypothetical protein